MCVRMTLVALFLASGCSNATLEGDWAGEITCPGGSAAGLELELEEGDGRTDEGDGVTWFNDSYGYYWEITFDIVLEHKGLNDGAEVDADVNDCVEIDFGEQDCPKLQDVVYNDDDTLEGDMDSFVGFDGCSFEVELD